jgi:hypothetical protein
MPLDLSESPGRGSEVREGTRKKPSLDGSDKRSDEKKSRESRGVCDSMSP